MLSIPYRLLAEQLVHVWMQEEDTFILHKHVKQSLHERTSYIALPVASYVRQGTQLIRRDDGETCRIQAGEIAIFRPGIYTVSDLLAEAGAFETILFFFPISLLKQLPALAKTKGPAQPYVERAFAQVKAHAALEYLGKSLEEQQARLSQLPQGLTPLKILEFLTLLLDADEAHSLARHLAGFQNPSSRNLRQLMEAHYDKPLTLADFASLSGRSLSSFKRDFERYFESTPRQWLIQRRMAKAQQLMQKDSMNVTQVAFEVGYENVSHFIKAFKKHYQVTPKQFIRQSQSA